jgi:predicted DNA-binding protein
MAIEKNKIISLRLTQAEYERLKKLADQTGWSVSELIRNEISGKKKITGKGDIKRLLYEINKIGHNLNQIAKHVNTKKAVDRVVAEELIQIKTLLKKLADDC